MGPKFAQIRIRLNLVRVRESNNVLQAVQTNQTLLLELENKRNVLRIRLTLFIHVTLMSREACYKNVRVSMIETSVNTFVRY